MADGRLAFFTAGVELGIDEAAAHARVEDGDRHPPLGEAQWDRAGLQAPAIDEQGVIPLAHRRDEGVHDAACHPDELILGPLSQERQLLGGDVQLVKGVQGGEHSHFEGGAGAQAGPFGDVSADGGLEALHGVACIEQDADDSADVVAPGGDAGAGGETLEGVEREAIGLRERLRSELNFEIVPAAHRDGHLAVDGGGEDEAVVIVGMLTDQVHSSGAPGRDLGGAEFATASFLGGSDRRGERGVDHGVVLSAVGGPEGGGARRCAGPAHGRRPEW
ncbi:hypothetical protein D3C87_687700 [compost metagenome]